MIRIPDAVKLLKGLRLRDRLIDQVLVSSELFPGFEKKVIDWRCPEF